MRLHIVYEDDFLAIIVKPAGISVSGNQYRTIENALLDNVKTSTQSNALKWPRPVHRLDNQTSGLLIVSKTIDVHVKLGQMFEQKLISKYYYAVVMGKADVDGIISTPVNMQSAVTLFERIKIVPSLRNEYLSLLKLSPQTGRTHQLRIHLSQQGWPILGDKLYGFKGNILLKDGLYLCATSLLFKHPITNEVLDISTPIPHKFLKRMQNEERRWIKYKV
ncbi:MAG: RluA family pseudouridine synthase [Marinilabiliaceae bacterium]|nr:RluA family pseudouridine synthase [Marinilabiliaceae bacterium]